MTKNFLIRLKRNTRIYVSFHRLTELLIENSNDILWKHYFPHRYILNYILDFLLPAVKVLRLSAQTFTTAKKISTILDVFPKRAICRNPFALFGDKLLHLFKHCNPSCKSRLAQVNLHNRPLAYILTVSFTVVTVCLWHSPGLTA